jgi:hypothetical protein
MASRSSPVYTGWGQPNLAAYRLSPRTRSSMLSSRKQAKAKGQVFQGEHLCQDIRQGPHLKLVDTYTRTCARKPNTCLKFQRQRKSSYSCMAIHVGRNSHRERISHHLWKGRVMYSVLGVMCVSSLRLRSLGSSCGRVRTLYLLLIAFHPAKKDLAQVFVFDSQTSTGIDWVLCLCQMEARLEASDCQLAFLPRTEPSLLSQRGYMVCTSRRS